MIKTIFQVAVISFIVILINALPNYYAYLNTPQGYVFSGQASWFDPWDLNVYVSSIKYGQNHGLMLKNIYTTEESTGVLMYPVYTLTGNLFLNINAFLLFHISAAVTGILLVFSIYKLSKVFLKNTAKSIFTTFLISLGGGLGWLVYPSVQAADLSMTGFTFISHFQRPHEALGILLYISALILFYLNTQKLNWKTNSLFIICSAILIFFYPYYLLSLGLIEIIYLIYVKEFNKAILANFLISGLVLVIYYLHLSSSSGFGSVFNQKLPNPGLIEIITGLGILFPIYIWQIFKKAKSKQEIFLNIWIIVSLVLLILPLGFARFYLRSLFFPLVILVILNLESISLKLRIPIWLFGVILCLIMPLSNIYITYRRVSEANNNNPWYYHTNAENSIFEFIKNNIPPDSGILTAYQAGNFIPTLNNNKVFFGHLIQTPKFQEKYLKLMKFYANIYSNEEALNFLKQENIKYIYWGKEEQVITLKYSKLPKLNYEFLKSIKSSDNITLYTIN